MDKDETLNPEAEQLEEARDLLSWLWGATYWCCWMGEESDAALADDVRRYLAKWRPRSLGL